MLVRIDNRTWTLQLFFVRCHPPPHILFCVCLCFLSLLLLLLLLVLFFVFVWLAAFYAAWLQMQTCPVCVSCSAMNVLLALPTDIWFAQFISSFYHTHHHHFPHTPQTFSHLIQRTLADVMLEKIDVCSRSFLLGGFLACLLPFLLALWVACSLPFFLAWWLA